MLVMCNNIKSKKTSISTLDFSCAHAGVLTSPALLIVVPTERWKLEWTDIFWQADLVVENQVRFISTTLEDLHRHQ